MMHSIILKAGREKSLLRRHPWVFSGAIASVIGNPGSGETVEVRGAAGAFLGLGAYSPVSQIRVRMWTFDAEEAISPAFFYARLRRAVEARSVLTEQRKLTAYRLVNAESDSLPGLIVDRYNQFLVCQFMSTGVEYWKKAIAESLQKLVPCDGIYERSDMSDREKEGLKPVTGVLSGAAPPDYLEIVEDRCRFLVDVREGHKTGFYLDQRDNRICLADFARDAEVLNCFAYTGAFGIWALQGGAARVTNVEVSGTALELVGRNAEINGCDTTRIENVQGDAFQVLREYHAAQRLFDVIILDPPKFVASRQQLARACRGYKDINLLAFRLLRPGGLLFTFSCSGLMARELFNKVVADAALDAGRDAQIIRHFTQASDHPTSLCFPEGNYLKGLLCRCAD